MISQQRSLLEGGCLPLFRWPGGKRQLVPLLRRFVPPEFGTYYEPFFGGGALFFSLAPHNAHVSDRNHVLMEMYSTVRDHPGRVLGALADLPISASDYYRIRSEKPSGRIARAARFVYLVSLSFNGLYRENRNGDFNTPYSNRTKLPFDLSHVYEVSRVLSAATIETLDFEDAMSRAGKNDLIYVDPPYTVAHGKNGFVQYNARLFSWEDQERLAKCVADAASRGCHVIVSNAEHSSIARLYRDFTTALVERSSTMAASSTFRETITECIFHNLPGVENAV